jgi:hypothetical protein
MQNSLTPPSSAAITEYHLRRGRRREHFLPMQKPLLRENSLEIEFQKDGRRWRPSFL